MNFGGFGSCSHAVEYTFLNLGSGDLLPAVSCTVLLSLFLFFYLLEHIYLYILEHAPEEFLEECALGCISVDLVKYRVVGHVSVSELING